MKRISFIAAAATAFWLGCIAVQPPGGSEARAAELVSVNDLGTDSGNGVSSEASIASISTDGTKVAFSSRASDLVATDTNGTQDIYVRDLTAGTTTLVSINDLGTDSGNSFSIEFAISADGTKVAFESFASDLGPTDTNGIDASTGGHVWAERYDGTLGGAAELDDAAPDALAVDPSTHHAGERHSRASGRVRHRGAGWSAGGAEAGFDRFRPD